MLSTPNKGSRELMPVQTWYKGVNELARDHLLSYAPQFLTS